MALAVRTERRRVGRRREAAHGRARLPLGPPRPVRERRGLGAPGPCVGRLPRPGRTTSASTTARVAVTTRRCVARSPTCSGRWPARDRAVVLRRRRGPPLWPLLTPFVVVCAVAVYAYGAVRFRAIAEPSLLGPRGRGAGEDRRSLVGHRTERVEDPGDERNRASTDSAPAGVAAASVTTLATAVAGWCAMWSSPLNGDEAYLLISLREWGVRGALRPRLQPVRTVLLHALRAPEPPARRTLDTASGRLTSLALWVVTAALFGLVVGRSRAAGSSGRRAGPRVLRARHPRERADAPGCPARVLLAALLADVAWLRPRHPRIADVIAGALAARDPPHEGRTSACSRSWRCSSPRVAARAHQGSRG